MKRKTAKEILAESFRELAETKPIDKITVKEIAGNCGYSSATFYRQFQDKYDLIAWAYSRDMEQIVGQIAFDEVSWRQVVRDAADYYSEHKEYMTNLLLHTSGYDSFISNMTEINYSCMKKQILEASGFDELDEQTDMVIRSYVMGAICLSAEWILGRYSVGPDELAEIYDRALPDLLKKYLYKK